MTEPELKSILYVDDEPHIRELVQMSIELEPGLEIRCVDGGEAAFRELEASLPDLVLLDNMLPGMDGPSILKAVQARAEWAGLPVVFITAKTMPAEVARLKELGAIGVIAKPFDPMNLAQDLRAIWNQARRRAHP